MKRNSPDHTHLLFAGSPFLISKLSNSEIHKAFGLVEVGYSGDWAISKVLMLVAKKHKCNLARFLTMKSLHSRYGTSPEDLQNYYQGLIIPLILIDACCTWHFLGQESSERLFRDEINRTPNLYKYIHEAMIDNDKKLILEKNSLKIFDYIRKKPYSESAYFGVGLEASENAFIQFSNEIAKLHNAIEFGFRF